MTKDGKDCIDFLQWALPQMLLRWEGFKKVRGQVCRRIRKRMAELQLEDFNAYKHYIQANQQEWITLDQLTHIHISRFFRDRKAWEALGEELLRELAERAHTEKRTFRCWSAACASGEEAYSMAILWKNKIAPHLPPLQLELIATDKDEKILDRARKACYTPGSVKEVPEEWKKEAFKQEEINYCLKPSYTQMVSFYQQDIRKEMPENHFDLIFCKNLVGMYFSKDLATELFRKISERMRTGALLILGNHEEFPVQEVAGIIEVSKGMKIYRKL